MEVSLAIPKSLTLLRLDTVGVGQSFMPLELGWNKLCILFLIGGFSSYIERILDAV